MDEEEALIIIDGALTDKDIQNSEFLTVFCAFQNTPKKFIKQRPGRGGRVSYVEGWYIKQILNAATKFKWSSYIDKAWIEHDQVMVIGRVTITIDGKDYTQSSIGDAEIKYKSGTKTPVSIGDDYKAALTDMIKKCASQWGIASDVYSKRKEIE